MPIGTVHAGTDAATDKLISFHQRVLPRLH